MKELTKNSVEKIKTLPWGAITTIVTIVFSVGIFQLSRIDRDIDALKHTMDRDFARIFSMFDSMKNDHNELMKEFNNERKDFHGRMCRLEEKYQQFRMDKEG